MQNEFYISTKTGIADLERERDSQNVVSFERFHLVDWSYLMSVWFPFKHFILIPVILRKKVGIGAFLEF